MPAVIANNLIIPGVGLPDLGIPIIGGNICPFDISISNDSANPSNIKVYFRYGSINQLLPTNIASSISVSKTGLFYVKAVVLTNGGVVTSSSIVVDQNVPKAQQPTPNSLPSTFEILIYIINNSSSYRMIGCGSIVLTGSLVFQTDKPVPAQPGVSTTIPYYIWQLSTA